MIFLAVVAAIEAVALVAVVLLFLRHLDGVEAQMAREPERVAHLEGQWTRERRELLNRIQRPEQPVVAPADSFVFPEEEPDEINLVGTIAESSLEE